MKNTLRERLRIRRSSQSTAQILEKSRKIKRTVLKECRKARNVMVYASFDGEVFTQDIITELFAMGRNVLVPKVRHHSIIPVRIKSLSELRPGMYCIPEPKGSRPFPLSDIDLVIVPGIGFDAYGHRIGFGAGLYDRFLPKVRCKKIGVAFEFQILKKIPAASHDIPVDMVVTEKRVLRFDRKVYK
ncbi:5-formyltetrahydrofolate cyclo-ligase [Candidatus Woesearchaeota archaeon]|nr:5-formyltetrahydrofolate cyclo-ligase [Candidatus Woesearchaeota archaeon]